MESAIVGDKGSTTLVVRKPDTKVMYYGYSKIDGSYHNARNAKGGTPLPPRIPRVRKHERIIHHHINTYDDWYRLIDATGKFVGSDNKSANYHLEMGYDNLYNITSKKLTMTQTNLQFAGKLSAGHEFNYIYSNDNPMQLASVETKQYNVDRTNMDPNDNFDPEQELLKNLHTQDYEFDDNGNMISVSVAKNEEPKPETENPEEQQTSEDGKDVLKSFLWDEENRLLAVNNNGSVSCYFYDAAGERTVKLTSETEMVHVNGKKVGGNDAVTKFTAYVSPYFVVSNGGAYTKHIYAASQRIASKLGNEDGFGADPRRVEQAGGKKISDFQKDNVGERFKALGYEYSAPEKEKVEKDSTMDSEEPENLVFFYHPDHLGSTSYVTDADGNIAQHIEYIPYGEVFVEERNNSFSTNYLFNAKELDNETGLYYYGARYLDPTGAMWLSVDPMWEKNIDANPYNYCHGNPVVMVDPDGRNDYGLDDNGKIWLIEETDLSTDKVYSGYKKNRKGEISHYGSHVEISKGVIKNDEEGANKYGIGFMYEFGDNEEEAKSFFEFAAENTHVEWSITKEATSDAQGTDCNVFTTRKARKESIGCNYAFRKAHKLIYHIHSHPDLLQGFEDAGNDNSVPGKEDIDFMDAVMRENNRVRVRQNKSIKEKGGVAKKIPYPEFKIFYVRKGVGKYANYTKKD